MRPDLRTETSVLVLFVSTVLKQRPRLTHLVDARIRLAAWSTSRLSKN